jgi:DNA-directed RNA polymerase subunit M/transcription elongation factor TFIIS
MSGKDGVMDTARAAIVKCLGGFFSKKEAKTYENLIFAMVLSDTDPSNETYVRIAYEKTGQLVEHREDGTMITSIVKDIKDGIKFYDSCVYDTQKKNYEKEMIQANQKPKAVKGVYQCKPPQGCGSDEFYIWYLQTRGGDEGVTIFRSCAKCNRRGKENS